jgi:hypothetical protein
METVTTFVTEAFAAQDPWTVRDLVVVLMVIGIALGCMLIGTLLENMRLLKELQRVEGVSELKWDAYLGAADEVDYLKQKVLRQRAVLEACELGDYDRKQELLTFSSADGLGPLEIAIEGLEEFEDDIPFK